MNYNFSGINNTREMREILQVLKTYNRIHASQGYSGNVDIEDFRQAYKLSLVPTTLLQGLRVFWAKRS